MPRPPYLVQPPPRTRLGPASFADDVAPIFDSALRAIEDSQIPYLLGGAFAFNAYTGIWRDTKDIDVFVKPSDADRVLKALEENGFETQMVYSSWLGKGWRGDIFVDVIWRNANGLFPVTDDWFEHAGETEIFGRRVGILSVEELILSKIMVGGRYRWDGADIAHILHAMGDRLDWVRLKEGAGEHVELLLAYLHIYRWAYPGWQDRVPREVMESFREAAEREAEKPREPFRGTLLDIPSFRVDVEGWGMPDPHKRVLSDIDNEGAETR